MDGCKIQNLRGGTAKRRGGKERRQSPVFNTVSWKCLLETFEVSGRQLDIWV